MPNLNKVMLMGNLTRDPELRYTPNNTPVVNLSVAVNRIYYNKQTNEKVEETTFVDCDAWGRTAEVISQYFQKGKPIFIEGRLKLDQWQDKDGGNRSKLKVVVESFEFIESRGGADGGSGRRANTGGANTGGPMTGSSGYSRGGVPTNDYNGPDQHVAVDDDDIPF